VRAPEAPAREPARDQGGRPSWRSRSSLRVLERLRQPTGLTHAVAAVIIGAGAAFRLVQYFSGRSLWLDESLLALNILGRSVTGLSHTLDFHQGAPLGFLVGVKTLVLAFGKSEEVLRLIPLLCGLAALPLMYVVARKVTSDLGALIALLLFSCAGSLVYYSSELKQYSCDVTAGLAISAVAITRGRPTWRRYVAVSVVGAIAIWFSHTTAFFVAAVTIAYAGHFVLERSWNDLRRMAVSSALWITSFVFFYFISFRDVKSLEAATGGVSNSSRLVDVRADVAQAIGFPLGHGGVPEIVRPVALAAAVVGGLLLLRQRIHAALILGLPIILMLFAAAIDKYPVFERTILFIIPAVIVFTAHGIASVWRPARRLPALAVVGVALTAFVAYHPVANAARHVAHPLKKEESKPLLRELARRWRPGDSLYVHYGAQYVFRYYAECGCLGVSTSKPPFSFATRRTEGPKLFSPALRSRPPHFIIGESQGAIEMRRRDIRRMVGQPRVWILFSHANSKQGLHFENVVLPRYLDTFGTQLAKITRFHATLFLYDLASRPGASPGNG
jgi:hypothetical protein